MSRKRHNTSDPSQQAQARAKAWQRAGERFDLIVHSPPVRASATAEIIGNALNTNFTIDCLWIGIKPPAMR